jgi:glucose/mannose-6-phosphate isomerase
MSQTDASQHYALLDDNAAMAALDPDGYMGLTLAFPDQCRRAHSIAEEFLRRAALPEQGVSQVVVTGLGGSAIGGDLLRSVAEECGRVPVIVNRDYDLPHFVGGDTLVLAASYSGNTEETLSAYRQARARGARIVAVTSGGALAEMAAEEGVPVCFIPGGQPPRASTGYMFFPMLAVLGACGLLTRDLGEVDAAFGLLDRYRQAYGPEVPTAANPAKQLAVELHGRIPVVYGSQGYRSVIAVRWKGQFNENAKQHAFANGFPEQNHNEILAWTLAGRQASNWSVVYLRDPDEPREAPRIARRVEVTKDIVDGAARQHEVWAEGRTLLEKMFSLFYFGDFVTVYVAYLNGIDPTDIAGIDRLKAELAKMDE